MDTFELATLTADPLWRVGLSFYFDEATRVRGRALGLNPFEYYGLGRGGTLGNVDTEVVQEAFTFWPPSNIERIWTKPAATADPVAVAADYLLAAYDYADRTFGAVDVEVLEKFALAARRVALGVESGTHLLFDGYMRFAIPSGPVHSAYLEAIVMRELRGGSHIRAVAAAGLTPVEANYIDDPASFTLHGYNDEEIPEVTPELVERKRGADEATSVTMASYFEVLTDDERIEFRDGALRMDEALSTPVTVTS
jgi:hypothetical protein